MKDQILLLRVKESEAHQNVLDQATSGVQTIAESKRALEVQSEATRKELYREKVKLESAITYLRQLSTLAKDMVKITSTVNAENTFEDMTDLDGYIRLPLIFQNIFHQIMMGKLSEFPSQQLSENRMMEAKQNTLSSENVLEVTRGKGTEECQHDKGDQGMGHHFTELHIELLKEIKSLRSGLTTSLETKNNSPDASSIDVLTLKGKNGVDGKCCQERDRRVEEATREMEQIRKSKMELENRYKSLQVEVDLKTKAVIELELLLKETKTNARQMEDKLSGDVERLQTEMESCDSQIQQLVKGREKGSDTLKEEFERKCKELEDVHYKQMSNELNNIMKGVTEASVKNKTLKDALVEKENELINIRSQLEIIIKEKESVFGKLQEYEKLCEEQSKELKSLKTKLDAEEKRSEETSKLLSETKESESGLQRALSQLKSLYHKMETDQTSLVADLEAQGKQLIEKEAVVNALLKEKSEIARVVVGVQAELDRYKKALEAMAKKLKSKSIKVKELIQEVEHHKEQTAKHNNEDKNVKQQLEQNVCEINSLKNDIVKFKEERDFLVAVVDDHVDERRREFTGILNRLRKSENDLELARKVVKAKHFTDSKAAKMATSLQKQVTDQRSKMDALQSKMQWLEEAFETAQKELKLKDTLIAKLQRELTSSRLDRRDHNTQQQKPIHESSDKVATMEAALEEASRKYANLKTVNERQEKDRQIERLNYIRQIQRLEHRLSTLQSKDGSSRTGEKVYSPPTRIAATDHRRKQRKPLAVEKMNIGKIDEEESMKQAKYDLGELFTVGVCQGEGPKEGISANIPTSELPTKTTINSSETESNADYPTNLKDQDDVASLLSPNCDPKTSSPFLLPKSKDGVHGKEDIEADDVTRLKRKLLTLEKLGFQLSKENEEAVVNFRSQRRRMKSFKDDKITNFA